MICPLVRIGKLHFFFIVVNLKRWVKVWRWLSGPLSVWQTQLSQPSSKDTSLTHMIAPVALLLRLEADIERDVEERERLCGEADPDLTNGADISSLWDLSQVI